MPTPRVFVSHNHSDIAFCRPFVGGLRAQGLDVWYDETNLLAGALRPKIEAVLQTCAHFVVILSPAAVASDWVNAEIDAALELERAGKLTTFLPVIAVPCEVPLLLRRYRRLAGPDHQPLSVDEAVRQSVAALTGATASLPTVPVAAPVPAVPAPAVQPAHNQGIVISGGSITAGALAVGTQASATQQVMRADTTLTQRGQEELRRRLDALAQAIATHGADLPNRGEAMQSLDAVARELANEQPNQVAVRAVLLGLMQSTHSVPAVATAAEALRAALDQLQ